MTAGHFVPVAASGSSSVDTFMSRAGAVRPGHRLLLPLDGAFTLRTVIKVFLSVQTRYSWHDDKTTASVVHPCACATLPEI